jgi:membrane protein implicated in regulation of membrane protease activity
MDNFKLVCPCLLGVEGLVSEELRAMDAKNVEPQNGRVVFDGSDEMLVRSNLWSRYGERILVQMGNFQALSFEDLFQGVKALPWERWIGKTDAFPVKGRSLSSKLSSVPDCQSIIKKAVVERLKQKYNLNWFEETGTLYQIQFLIMKDNVSIMIDTSGPGLTLIVTRPLVKKIMDFKKVDTNAGRYIGKNGVVITQINNTLGEGQVNVLGSVWTARSEDDSIIEIGENVRIKAIEGVKLIVEVHK